jgi:hypothetical protein
MATIDRTKPANHWLDTPVFAIDLPVMYEDEGQEEMGDTEPHMIATGIFYHGVKAHLAPRRAKRLQAYSNLNLYYHPIELKRLTAGKSWKDVCDADGGITSRLGFRLLIDRDGDLRVLNRATGKPYARPDEAQVEAEARQAEAQARQNADKRVQQLEAELERLRGIIRERKKNSR